MTRTDLARELFDIHQAMRDQVQAVATEATFAERRWPDSSFARNAAAAGKRLAELVARAERVLEGYVASSDSGRVNVHG